MHSVCVEAAAVKIRVKTSLMNKTTDLLLIQKFVQRAVDVIFEMAANLGPNLNALTVAMFVGALPVAGMALTAVVKAAYSWVSLTSFKDLRNVRI